MGSGWQGQGVGMGGVEAVTTRQLLQLSKRESRMEVVETESRDRFRLHFRINPAGLAEGFDVRVKE